MWQSGRKEGRKGWKKLDKEAGFKKGREEDRSEGKQAEMEAGWKGGRQEEWKARRKRGRQNIGMVADRKVVGKEERQAKRDARRQEE